MNRDKHDELNELNLSEQERANFERLLSEFKDTTRRKADRPDVFWASMWPRVAARIREPESHKGLGWLASVAAATAMIVFMAVPSHSPQHTVKVSSKGNAAVTATASNSANATTDDEALLRSVAETTNSEVPDALAPATVLTSEMDRGLAGGKIQR